MQLQNIKSYMETDSGIFIHLIYVIIQYCKLKN